MRARAVFVSSIAVLGVGLAAPAAHAATLAPLTSVPPLSSCASAPSSQPFTAFKDKNFYTQAPGGDFESATGGWDLSGGATLVSTDRGGVLDLPSKAQATSPVMCITSDYPTARMWVRNLAGAEGVFFYVSYYRNGTWTAPKNTGQFHGDKSNWTLANPLNVQPDSAPGWQQVRFTFVAGGNTSNFEVDDFWVDPRARF
jgi:hypothetical protein